MAIGPDITCVRAIVVTYVCVPTCLRQRYNGNAPAGTVRASRDQMYYISSLYVTMVLYWPYRPTRAT